MSLGLRFPSTGNVLKKSSWLSDPSDWAGWWQNHSPSLGERPTHAYHKPLFWGSFRPMANPRSALLYIMHHVLERAHLLEEVPCCPVLVLQVWASPPNSIPESYHCSTRSHNLQSTSINTKADLLISVCWLLCVCHWSRTCTGIRASQIPTSSVLSIF